MEKEIDLFNVIDDFNSDMASHGYVLSREEAERVTQKGELLVDGEPVTMDGLIREFKPDERITFEVRNRFRFSCKLRIEKAYDTDIIKRYDTTFEVLGKWYW